ncbi:hypothetical protein Tel_08205 [Candidatus Tenderia electrophaga]|jgi:Ca2+-transporting ATPase|uniref:Cation-transporting P-type ATPase C-terminal domain-containing protein n=1 Tax=Candidatus Tenderia electrophaga TaxID=1748243 RepID=A0A0S2TDF5_9GAMM|nr:hypothetical protein Tel_08205 [Candidatus Tenderia electrophaga]
MVIRSETQSLWRQGVLSNLPLLGAVVLQLAVTYVPGLNTIFKTEALSLFELGACFVLPLIVFGAVEIEKMLRRARTNLFVVNLYFPPIP